MDLPNHNQTFFMTNRQIQLEKRFESTLIEMNKLQKKIKKGAKANKEVKKWITEQEKMISNTRDSLQKLTQQQANFFTRIPAKPSKLPAQKTKTATEENTPNPYHFLRLGDHITIQNKNHINTGIYIKSSGSTLTWIDNLSKNLRISNLRGLTIYKV